ncbi:hypothetical protein H4R34_002874 [Dimargaris verticillata]|uniref:Phytanoyl-CoA dioxygenase n=1 Tax=Dimargaris verticillata TaxID=2761393 RepID=A0A9W8B1T2_9FUNG|nr:hypothetical protein H4R34_002874 [Dimargaris verticillata]
MGNPGKAKQRKLIAHFNRYGYAVIERALDESDTQLLRHECDSLVNHCYLEDDVVHDLGCVIEPLTSGIRDTDVKDRLRLRHSTDLFRQYRGSIHDPRVTYLLLSKLGRVAQMFLPTTDGPYLLNEQYIVKPPRSGRSTEFAWHQDSQYLPSGLQQEPAVSCWVALNDVAFDNGTVIVDPYPSEVSCQPDQEPQQSVASYITHHTRAAQSYSLPRQTFAFGRDTQSPDDIPGRYRIITMPAGSILVMSGLVYHCSSPNDSASFRRCWMPQYSANALYHLPPSLSDSTASVPTHGVSVSPVPPDTRNCNEAPVLETKPMGELVVDSLQTQEPVLLVALAVPIDSRSRRAGRVGLKDTNHHNH